MGRCLASSWPSLSSSSSSPQHNPQTSSFKWVGAQQGGGGNRQGEVGERFSENQIWPKRFTFFNPVEISWICLKIKSDEREKHFELGWTQGRDWRDEARAGGGEASEEKPNGVWRLGKGNFLHTLHLISVVMAHWWARNFWNTVGWCYHTVVCVVGDLRNENCPLLYQPTCMISKLRLRTKGRARQQPNNFRITMIVKPVLAATRWCCLLRNPSFSGDIYLIQSGVVCLQLPCVARLGGLADVTSAASVLCTI